MAEKIQRQTQKIFGGQAANDELAVFGSFKSGNPIYTDNIEDLQSEAYEQGWEAAIAANEAPFLEEMNGVQYGFSKQLAYIFQEGIPEYDINTTYYKGSWCKGENSVGQKAIYESLIDENSGNPLSDSNAWNRVEFGSSSGGLEVGYIGFTQGAVNEASGLKRALNKDYNVITKNANTIGFFNWLRESSAINPDMLCTNAEFETTLTMSKEGICDKYVFIDDDTIRLPKYPNYLMKVKDYTSSVSFNTGNTIPVLGNGMTLGLTNGTINVGLNSTAKGVMWGYADYYGQPYGQGTAQATAMNTSVGVTTDSTKSGIVADVSGLTNSFSSTSEKITGTWYIQIATGQETEVNIINDIELNNPATLLESKYSEYELYNDSWLRSEGQWNNGEIYIKSYEALQVEYNTEIETGTTVALPSGTNYTKRGLPVKLVTEGYTDLDFILNTTDITFRLPLKTKYTVTADNLYLYFYVGETALNPNLIDTGRITEEIVDIKKELSNKLNHNQVTNCILEIPQRIKYTLEDGVLTLKAGSVCIIPYGTEDLRETYPIGSTFINDNMKVVNTQWDGTRFFVWAETQIDLISQYPSGDNWTGYSWLVITSGNVYLGLDAISLAGTGTPPDTGQYYQLTENLIYSNGNTNNVIPFPLFKITASSTAVESVEQVFNGWGYIGYAVYQDKGIKALIADGFNDDGSYKNLEVTTDHLSLSLIADSDRTLCVTGTGNIYNVITSQIWRSTTQPNYSGSLTNLWYNPDTNQFRTYHGGKWLQAYYLPVVSYNIANSATDNACVSDWKPKKVFQAADAQNLDGQWVNKSMALTLLQTLDIGTDIRISYDLSSYLPNDGYTYEVLFSIDFTTGAASGASFTCSMISPINDQDMWSRIAAAQTRATTAVIGAGNAILPIGLTRIVIFNYIAEVKAPIVSIYAEGYRRLGY